MMQKSLPTLFFERMPKAELHCHLDGSLRRSTLNELAQSQHILVEKSLFGQIHASLEKYLERFSTICQVMQNEANIKRVAFELVEDAALENIFHIEYRFCPTLLTQEGLTLEQVTRAAIEGGREAAEKYAISFGVILCGIRSFAPDKNVEIAKTAIAFLGKGVVGFDIAGPEFGFPVKEHAESFELVNASSMNVTVHAGEGYGPDSIEQAIRYCSADRIGHGTRLIENPLLLKLVIEKKLPLEICLTSNEQTGVVRTVAEHPLPIYLSSGAVATLCTDNRLVSETTLSREFERAHRELGLDFSALKKLSLFGFQSAFVSDEEKEVLLKRAEKEFDKLAQELQLN